MSDFKDLREKYPVFEYRAYEISETDSEVTVRYFFSVPELADFKPSWTFPKPENISLAKNLTFERLAFSLGMAELVSYWKAVCSPEIKVFCGELTREQVTWWKKLYFNGLGEFFYVNKIETDIKSFVKISCDSVFHCEKERPVERSAKGCLVPIGGGKDSALTLETLVNAGYDCKCYCINKRNSVSETVNKAGLPESSLITAVRNFDRSLVELNKKGFLNGHTPFSSIVAFSAEITAYLNNRRYIVLSNEDSANESTVSDSTVNHQYSKSFEFERDFHNYEKNYLKTGIYYFSFLRPLSEFQIAKMFCHYKKYLKIFRSCNLGSKKSPDIWCGECPKCLFVSLILSPFVSREELVEIFGKDLLNDTSMEEYFVELVGKSEHKPFECVGSIGEVNLAVTLAIRKYVDENRKLPFLFQKYIDMGLYSPDTVDARNEKICRGFSEKNLLPDDFREILIEETERLL